MAKIGKSPRIILSVCILFSINLLNYMDRYTIAGVLTNIQAFYNINDAQGGLLQTVFMVFFMFCSPVCGFLGDRYNRKWIMVVGITIWVATVFASTFIPQDKFWLFLLLRGIVGVGEASYAVISPSIIADMFTGQNRSRMLMVFYFAIPCGSGLGFIVGSNVAALTGHWTWGVRVTAIFGILCLVMIIVFIEEPERGGAERLKGEIAAAVVNTSYWDDIKALATNLTYVFSTAGYTAIVFVVGTLTWWAPTAIEHNDAYKQGLNSTDSLSPDMKAQCTHKFHGFQLLRTGWGPLKFVQTIRSDPIICGVGALIGVPTLYFSLHLIPTTMAGAWILMFVTITATCFNWATNVDMLMISDAIRGDDSSPYGHFHSLITSFYLPNALLLVSTALFFVAAYTFVNDNRKFKEYMGVLKPATANPSLRDGTRTSTGADNWAFSVPEGDHPETTKV
ncbi:transporter, major facilitator family protein [Ancylostoma ceylanicum]|uniref:Transporter, major facilitator family protein n=1 Tax=Ancylostoma ceylanicum TaxID=53326 RepID=A0A0D6LKM1_9BILA|nr:transporter, major facilitator family protein [Ancylostoma ceylanicum]